MRSKDVVRVYSLYLKKELADEHVLNFVEDAIKRGDSHSAYYLSRMVYSRAADSTKQKLTKMLLSNSRQDLVPLDHKLALRRNPLR